MKVDSLVKCIYGFCREKKHWPTINFPVKGEIYTVSAIEEAATYGGKSKGIMLFEIINTPTVHQLTNRPERVWFWIKRFREVQPPMDMRFINEIQLIKSIQC